MRRSLNLFLLLIWSGTLALPWASRHRPPAYSQKVTATPTPPASASTADVQALMSKMTAADKVGQLFLVTFMGSSAADNSDIAILVRDYRVGGVVLLP